MQIAVLHQFRICKDLGQILQDISRALELNKNEKKDFEPHCLQQDKQALDY
jgi:hypothetical protein